MTTISGAKGAPVNLPAYDLTSAGTTDAVEEFVRAQGPRLVRMARALLEDPHNAEDVVQDVFAKVIDQWPKISRADNVEAYVTRMVVNACTSWWRRAVRREWAGDPFTLPENPVAAGDEQFVQHEYLISLLRELPAKQRAVLVLRHYESLRDDEIADLLGCSPGTVRSNAHRGLSNLKAMISRDGDDPVGER